MGDSHKKNVLNEGYVILHDIMGSDLSVVNAARCSYARKSEVMDEKDERLIRYLAKHGHTSPFRHAVLQFEFKAPLMVARQHFKYIVGSSFQEATGDNMLAWNEESRRYVRGTPTFYIPDADEWRYSRKNLKSISKKALSFTKTRLLVRWHRNKLAYSCPQTVYMFDITGLPRSKR